MATDSDCQDNSDSDSDYQKDYNSKDVEEAADQVVNALQDIAKHQMERIKRRADHARKAQKREEAER